MSAPLLSFDDVSLWRGGRVLFEHLNLIIGAGDGLHLCGPNGVGKSSLIRLAAGLLRAASGTVHRSGFALADDALALDPELPLRQALLFWCALARGQQRCVDEALETLGLRHLADVPVRLLSAGQAKRATLARVVASQASLWLLDEPLNGLDAEGVERLAHVLAVHRAGGGGVLAASHMPLPGAWTQLELGH
ncbi:MAG: heme ABC exporter ATP-binding protein CcmA [Sphingomicrobium sp.]